MDADLRRRLEASHYGTAGFAVRYDAMRPRPPEALRALLPPLAGVGRLRAVVDLGAGTGLSTRFWSDAADEVIGVEPNPAMCRYATQVTAEPNVRYVEAPAEATGLPSGTADLVTAAQSLQWMEPEATFREIARLLRPGGVFCAYEYFSLQTPLWEPEAAWAAVRQRTGHRRAELGFERELQLWPTGREPLERSGVFRWVRELAVHSVEQGDGQRLVGFALSEGSLQAVLAAGVAEEEIGFDELRRAASRMTQPVPWWIGYRVWLGQRP